MILYVLDGKYGLSMTSIDHKFECAICLVAQPGTDAIPVETPCHHRFHLSCLLRSFRESPAGNRCPLCRGSSVTLREPMETLWTLLREVRASAEPGSMAWARIALKRAREAAGQHKPTLLQYVRACLSRSRRSPTDPEFRQVNEQYEEAVIDAIVSDERFPASWLPDDLRFRGAERKYLEMNKSGSRYQGLAPQSKTLFLGKLILELRKGHTCGHGEHADDLIDRVETDFVNRILSGDIPAGNADDGIRFRAGKRAVGHWLNRQSFMESRTPRQKADFVAETIANLASGSRIGAEAEAAEWIERTQEFLVDAIVAGTIPLEGQSDYIHFRVGDKRLALCQQRAPQYMERDLMGKGWMLIHIIEHLTRGHRCGHGRRAAERIGKAREFLVDEFMAEKEPFGVIYEPFIDYLLAERRLAECRKGGVGYARRSLAEKRVFLDEIIQKLPFGFEGEPAEKVHALIREAKALLEALETEQTNGSVP